MLNIKNSKKIWMLYRKVLNSFFYPRMWMYTFGLLKMPLGKKFEDFIIERETNRPNTLYRKIELKFLDVISRLFFLPTSTNYLIWYLRDKEGEEKYPADFQFLDSRSILYLDKILSYTDTNDSILDVGCNCGRHLNYLVESGYTKLQGFDLSQNALHMMQKWFPKLSDVGEFYHGTFGSYFLGKTDKSVDVVISFGATIENCHPSLDIVMQMCRVARKYVIININIDGHSYPRLWEYEFRKNGFELVEKTSCVGKNSRIPTMIFKTKSTWNY